jgi:hypothetical protein
LPIITSNTQAGLKSNFWALPQGSRHPLYLFLPYMAAKKGCHSYR